MAAVIGALRVNLGIDTAAFTKGLNSAQARLAAAGKRMRNVGAGLSVISAGVAAGIKSTLNGADAMAKSAQKFGVPIEELSALAYAGDLAGVSLDKMGTGLGRLSRQMNDAKNGLGEAVDVFDQLGVEFGDAEGNLRPVTEVLADISDKFASMPDGAEKTALAMDAMGRSGAELIPLLNGGSDALKDMIAEAGRLGVVITPEMGKNAEEFNDNLTRLRASLAGIGIVIAGQLAPILVNLSDKVVSLVGWFQELSPRVKRFTAVGAGIVVILGPAVTALGLLVIGIAAIGAPIAAAIAAFAALTAVMVAFLPEVNAAKAAIVQFVQEGLEYLVEKFEQTVDQMTGLATAFRQIGVDIIDGLLAGLRERWQTVRDWFTGLADKMPEWMRGPLGIQSPSTVFAKIGRDVMDGLNHGLETNADTTRGIMTGLAGDLSSNFKMMLQGATDFESAISSVIDGVGQRLIDSSFTQFGALIGIPGFASGTSFAPGGLALVGESGPELVNLPRGAQVIPNHDLRGMGGGTHITVDVSGSNGDAEIERRVRAGVTAGLAQQSATFGDRSALARSDPRWRGSF